MKRLTCVVFLVFVIALAQSKPTIYKKNNNDKLEPVLVAVSSTVIPLPVYKVGFSVGVTDTKLKKPDSPTKLITAPKKKLPKDDDEVTIKQVSKDEFTKP